MTASDRPAPPPDRLPDGHTGVTLSRTDARDVAQRQIYARIDDGPTHTLVYGDVRHETLAPGPHRLRANNTLFWKSRTFTLEPGEQVEFVLVNGGGAIAVSILAILGVGPLTLTIEKRPGR